jgi:beta-glucanase (GH16 family)
VRVVGALRPRDARARRAGALLLLSAFATISCVGSNGRAQAGSVGWQVVWSDDFTGKAGSPPSAGNWIVDLGTSYPGGPAGWGTGEVETSTGAPRNLALDGGGNLALTATRDSAGRWSSARIETRRADFRPDAGGSLKIEARIRLPDGGQGYWPAFWALGAPYRQRHIWPGSGEIDTMENVNNDSTVHGTLHCGPVQSGGPCHEDTGLTGSYQLAGPAGDTGFHTYTVIWSTSPRQLQWLVDGRPYWTVTPAMTGDATWTATFDHGYFLLLDLAIGGGWPGNPDAGTVPGRSMLVDYVTVSRSSSR